MMRMIQTMCHPGDCLSHWLGIQFVIRLHVILVSIVYFMIVVFLIYTDVTLPFCKCSILSLSLTLSSFFTGFLPIFQSPLRPGKSLKTNLKSLNLYQKVLESAGIWFCNILYLNMGLSVLVLDARTLHVKLLNVHWTFVDVLSKIWVTVLE